MAYSSDAITAQEKLREVEREISQRRRVYVRLVVQKKLRQEVADRQLAIMIAVRDDMKVLADKERSL